MKALTIWQPWATLIAAGAKPYEFRKWDYRTRDGSLEGQRIIVHAGAREIKRAEMQDLLMRINTGDSALKIALARPIVERALTSPGAFPLSAGLCTAVLGMPRQASKLFGLGADSDRVDHSLWAWPLTDIQAFEPIIPCRGFQGFWNWPKELAA